MKTKIVLFKTISWALIMCLVASDIAFAAQANRNEYRVQRTNQFEENNQAHGTHYAVPEKLGYVEESFQGSNGKKIIFIQDAHDSLEAQKNIARLISHYVKQGVQTVFEEGYEGEVPTEKYFSQIQDAATKRKISFYYLDHLKIGAAEYAHINRQSRLAKRPETGDQRNKQRAVSRKEGSVLDAKQRGLTPMVSNSELQTTHLGTNWKLVGADDRGAYLENIQAFADNEKSRQEIAKHLRVIFKQFAVVAKNKFSKKAQSWIRDFFRYESEKISLVDYLVRTLVLFQADEQKAWPVLSTARETYLVDGGRPQKLTKAQEQQAWNILRAAKAKEVLSELKSVQQTTEQKLFQTTEEKELWHFLLALRRLSRLTNLQLAPHDLEILKADLSALETEKLAAWLAKNKKSPLVLSKAWEKQIQTALRFYELAAIRERAVEKTLLDWKQETRDKKLTPNTRTAVLVFGGFHREGICRILREQGFSYQVITPRISEFSSKHQKIYRHLMSAGAGSVLTKRGLTPMVSRNAARPPSVFISMSPSELRSEVRLLSDFAAQNPGLSAKEFSFRAEKIPQPEPGSGEVALSSAIHRSETRGDHPLMKVEIEESYPGESNRIRRILEIASKKIPASHARLVTKIKLEKYMKIKQASRGHLFPQKAQMYGQAKRGSGVILLYDTLQRTEKKLLHVIAHEIGHLIDFPEARKKWAEKVTIASPYEQIFRLWTHIFAGAGIASGIGMLALVALIVWEPLLLSNFLWLMCGLMIFPSFVLHGLVWMRQHVRYYSSEDFAESYARIMLKRRQIHGQITFTDAAWAQRVEAFKEIFHLIEERESWEPWLDAQLERLVQNKSKKEILKKIFVEMTQDYEKAFPPKGIKLGDNRSTESYLHAFVNEALGALQADSEWIQQLANGAKKFLETKKYPHAFVGYALLGILVNLQRKGFKPKAAQEWFEVFNQALVVIPNLHPQVFLDAASEASGSLDTFKKLVRESRSEMREKLPRPEPGSARAGPGSGDQFEKKAFDQTISRSETRSESELKNAKNWDAAVRQRLRSRYSGNESAELIQIWESAMQQEPVSSELGRAVKFQQVLNAVEKRERKLHSQQVFIWSIFALAIIVGIFIKDEVARKIVRQAPIFFQYVGLAFGVGFTTGILIVSFRHHDWEQLVAALTENKDFIQREWTYQTGSRSEARRKNTAEWDKEAEARAIQMVQGFAAYLPNINKWMQEKTTTVQSAKAQLEAINNMAGLLDAFKAKFPSAVLRNNKSVATISDAAAKSLYIWQIYAGMIAEGSRGVETQNSLRESLERPRLFIGDMQVHLRAKHWKKLNDYYDGNVLHPNKVHRSEMRISGISNETPIWSFLQAFGIDPAQAIIESKNGIWGRVQVGQHSVLGLTGEKLQSEVHESLEVIMTQSPMPSHLIDLLKAGSPHGQYDAYLLTYNGMPAALVWPELGEKREVVFYPLKHPRQETFFGAAQALPLVSNWGVFESLLKQELSKRHQVNEDKLHDATKNDKGQAVEDSFIQNTNSGFYFPTVFPPHELSSAKVRGKVKNLIETGKIQIAGNIAAEIGSGAGVLAKQMLGYGAKKVHAVDISLLKLMNTQAQSTSAPRHEDLILHWKDIPAADFYAFNAPNYTNPPLHLKSATATALDKAENANIYMAEGTLKQIFFEASEKANAGAQFLIRIFIAPNNEKALKEMFVATGWDIEMEENVQRRIQFMTVDGDGFLQPHPAQDQEKFFLLKLKSRSETWSKDTSSLNLDRQLEPGSSSLEHGSEVAALAPRSEARTLDLWVDEQPSLSYAETLRYVSKWLNEHARGTKMRIFYKESVSLAELEKQLRPSAESEPVLFVKQTALASLQSDIQAVSTRLNNDRGEPAKYIKALWEPENPKIILDEYGLSAPPLVFANIRREEFKLVSETVKILLRDGINTPIVITPYPPMNIEELIKDLNGVQIRKWSTRDARNQSGVLILDTFGEQYKLLRVSALAVYGNTLIRQGDSHNLAEANGVITGKFLETYLNNPRPNSPTSSRAIKAYQEHKAVIEVGLNPSPEKLAAEIEHITSNAQEVIRLNQNSLRARQDLYQQALPFLNRVLEEHLSNTIRSEMRKPATAQRGGTVLISREELAGLSEAHFDAFYKYAYQQLQLRFVVYGNSSAGEARLRGLKAIPNAGRRLSEAFDELSALKKVRKNERGVLLQKFTGNIRQLPKNVNRARTDGLPHEMALGFYALLESAGIKTDANGFYFDPSGWISSQIREFLNNQVFARAA